MVSLPVPPSSVSLPAPPVSVLFALLPVSRLSSELPVPLIYLDEQRTFGGILDDAQTRMEYYHLTIDRSLAAAVDEFSCCPVSCEDGEA